MRFWPRVLAVAFVGTGFGLSPVVSAPARASEMTSVYVLDPQLHISRDDPAYALLDQQSGLLADAMQQARGCRDVVATQDLRDDLAAEADHQRAGLPADESLAARLAKQIDSDELVIVSVYRDGAGYQVNGTLWDQTDNRARMRATLRAGSPSKLPETLGDLAQKLAGAEACHGWSGTITVRRDLTNSTVLATEDGHGAIHEEVTYTVQPGGKAHYQARVLLENTTTFKSTTPGQPRTQTTRASGDGSGECFADLTMNEDGIYSVMADGFEVEVQVVDSGGLSGKVPYAIGDVSASGRAAPTDGEVSGTWSQSAPAKEDRGVTEAEQDKVTWHFTRS
jgi:hypothetical protein